MDYDQRFRLRVEDDLKYSLTFWFWWHVSELWARLCEARRMLRRS